MRSSSLITAAIAMAASAGFGLAASAGFGEHRSYPIPQRYARSYPIPQRYARSRPGNRTQPQAGDKLARKAAKGKIGVRG